MRPGWTDVRLGEVLSVDIDAVPVDPTQIYPFSGVYGFGRGLFRREPVAGTDTTYSHFHRLHENQVVMSQPKGWEGAITVVPKEFEGRFLSSVFPTFRCERSRLDPSFMRVVTLCPWLWAELLEKSNGIGARRNAVYPQHLLEVTVPLPPLAEQQRIAARLDAIESRLARVRQIRELQTETLQAALRSAFHQMASAAQWRKFGEVSPVTRRPVEIVPEQRYEELGARSFGRGIFHKPSFRGDELTWERLFRVEEGDLVISNIKAWEGAIAVAGKQDHGRVGSHRYLTAVTDPTRLLPEVLCFYLLSPSGLEKIGLASPGSADRNRTLSVSRLEEIEVPVPPLAAQKEFQKLLALQTQVAARASESESATTALLPSLLDQIFN